MSEWAVSRPDERCVAEAAGPRRRKWMLRSGASIEIILGDCLKVMADLQPEGFGLIATDPPYPKQYKHLYWGIAEHGRRLLVRGGSYIAIVPQYSMPEILSEVGKHLKWRWLMTMWQEDGPHPRMAMGIEVMFKSLGWWVKDAWPQGRGFVKDGFDNPAPSKKNHEWEQSLRWAEYCLKFHHGGAVLDPCLGGGTMAVACAERGISFVGIENDPAAFQQSVDRLDIFLAEQELLSTVTVN